MRVGYWSCVGGAEEEAQWGECDWMNVCVRVYQCASLVLEAERTMLGWSMDSGDEMSRVDCGRGRFGARRDRM